MVCGWERDLEVALHPEGPEPCVRLREDPRVALGATLGEENGVWLGEDLEVALHPAGPEPCVWLGGDPEVALGATSGEEHGVWFGEVARHPEGQEQCVCRWERTSSL